MLVPFSFSRYPAGMSTVPLSQYPHVVVNVACRVCPRKGSYRLARLAVRYGSEIALTELLARLSADCERRKAGKVWESCGANFPDLSGV